LILILLLAVQGLVSLVSFAYLHKAKALAPTPGEEHGFGGRAGAVVPLPGEERGMRVRVRVRESCALRVVALLGLLLKVHELGQRAADVKTEDAPDAKIGLEPSRGPCGALAPRGDAASSAVAPLRGIGLESQRPRILPLFSFVGAIAVLLLLVEVEPRRSGSGRGL
jgi:hypothetical protein